VRMEAGTRPKRTVQFSAPNGKLPAQTTEPFVAMSLPIP